MKRAALVACLVACTPAAPLKPTPTNRAPDASRQITHLVVQAFEYYADMCQPPHHVTVVMDGAPAVTIATKRVCEPPMYGSGGGRMVVSESGPSGTDEAPPFDVAPGHHVFEIRDAEAKTTGRIEADFPVYQNNDRIPADKLGVNVGDDEMNVIGFGHEFLSM